MQLTKISAIFTTFPYRVSLYSPPADSEAALSPAVTLTRLVPLEPALSKPRTCESLAHSDASDAVAAGRTG